MSTISTTQAEIIEHSEPIQTLLNNPPKVRPPFTALLNWIVQLGFALVGLVANLTQPIMDQQEELAESARLAKVSSMPTSSVAATAGHSRTTRRTNASPKRCNRCHARSHTDDCKTTNPSAMRKRVARNNRIAKEVRRLPAQPPPSVHPPFPWLPHHYPPPYPSTAPTYHMASLATDAAELRRRSTQSARDKRRHRRSSQPS